MCISDLVDARNLEPGSIKCNPHHAVALNALVGGHFCFWWNTRWVFELRNVHAGARRIKLPAVVGAHDVVTLDASTRKRGAAMNANIA